MSILSGILDLVQGNRAANAVYTGYNDAMQGVVNTNKAANTDVNAAGQQAIGVVDRATGAGNDTIAAGLNKGVDLQQPYVDAGRAGVAGLSAPTPTFSWDPTQIAKDPSYQFTAAQGKEQIQNMAAAKGLGASGNVLKDLTQFAEKNANTFEDSDFDRALKTFTTNQDYRFKQFEKLADLGAHASDQTSGLYRDASKDIATNDISAGKYAGDTGTSVAKFLADLNNVAAVQGGNYRIGQAGATAGKDLNTGKAINTAGGGLADLLFGGGTFDAGSQILFGGKPSGGG